MPRTAGGLRTDTAARLAELQEQRPEWKSWIRLLAVAEKATHDEGWHLPLTQAVWESSGPAVEAPLLHGKRLQVDPARIQRWIGSLASAATSGDIGGGSSLDGYRPSKTESLELVTAAVAEDGDRIQSMALQSRLDGAALATVAHLAAYPLLQSCGRQLESQVSPAWQHGYCPVCAAWPTLAERRGLDRSRRLRCGRCAAQWEVPWLYCIYCGERNHQRLGSLEADDRSEMLKVETCNSCQGYLKSIASLQGFAPFDLLLQDLDTIELDLIALDRGYIRPARRGFVLNFQLLHHAPCRTL